MQAQLLRDGNIYENGRFSVRQYTEEQFAKYKASANIVGSVYLVPENVENEQERLLVYTQYNEVFQLRIYPLNVREKAFGYIYCGNMDFIKILNGNPSKMKYVKPKEEIQDVPPVKPQKPQKKKSKAPVFVVILVAIIACVGIGLFLFLPKEEEENPNPIQVPEVNSVPISDATTDIPLYVSFDLTKSESKINLSNPEGNTVDFVYEVYNGEKLLFSTDKIAPGNQKTVDIGGYLETGEHDLLFKIRCFLNGTEVNGTEEPVKVVLQ